MDITEENIRFWIYQAQYTKTFRYKCKHQLLDISQIMQAIDEDHIKILEEPCKRKHPRIGQEYQIQTLPNDTNPD